MEMLSRIMINLIACFIGWQLGKYIAIRLYIRKQMKNKRYEEEENDYYDR